MIRALSGDPGSRRSGAIGPCAGSTSVLGTLHLGSMGKGRLASSCIDTTLRREVNGSTGDNIDPGERAVASTNFTAKRRYRRESMRRSDAVLPFLDKSCRIAAASEAWVHREAIASPPCGAYPWPPRRRALGQAALSSSPLSWGRAGSEANTTGTVAID